MIRISISVKLINVCVVLATYVCIAAYVFASLLEAREISALPSKAAHQISQKAT
jgi:hypothetical protein